MNIQKIKLEKIQVNKDNPRTITKEKFDKLINSILVFPKMLEIRPIVVDGNFIALGGNQRTEALNEIANFSIEQIKERISSITDFERMEKEEQENLVLFWGEWIKNKDVPIINAEMLTEDEKKQFIIKDNSGFGDWDWNMMESSWDNELLEDWGLDVWDMTVEEKVKKAEKEKPDVPFTEILNEEHNFIVLYFDNTVDWLQAQTVFELEPRKCYPTKKGSTKRSMFGVGRVINGAKALNKLIGEKKDENKC